MLYVELATLATKICVLAMKKKVKVKPSLKLTAGIGLCSRIRSTQQLLQSIRVTLHGPRLSKRHESLLLYGRLQLEREPRIAINRSYSIEEGVGRMGDASSIGDHNPCDSATGTGDNGPSVCSSVCGCS